MFTEKGFLGEQVNKWAEENRDKNAEWFDLCDLITKISLEALYTIRVNERDLQGVLATALFSRILSSFQACEMLLYKGMIPQAEIMARAVLENGIILDFISRSFENAKLYYGNGIKQTISDANKLISYHKMRGNEEEIRKINDILVQYQKVENEYCEKKVTVFDMAKAIGRLAHYNTAYAFLSKSTHTRADDIARRHLDISENGYFKFKTFSPEGDGMEIIVITIADELNRGIDTVNKKFNLGLDDSVKSTIELIEALARKGNFV